jgi:integrase
MFPKKVQPAKEVAMASVSNRPNGHKWIQFVAPDGKRKTVRLGKCSGKAADTVRFRVECLLESAITGAMDRDTALWLRDVTERHPELRTKLAAVGLVEPLVPPDQITLDSHVADFISRVGVNRKPGTVAVWKQVQAELKKLMPPGVLLGDVNRGHAKQFHESLKQRGLATLTVVKHVRIAKQFFEDAVEWERIPTNPFAKIKLSASIPKHNVEVPRELIDSLMPTLDTTWQTIVALSRYGGLRAPSETLSLRWTDIDWERSRMAIPEPKVEHHEGRGVRSCPIFPELMPYLQRAWDEADEGAEFVIDKPAYRKAANTGTGWKNANLRTQLMKRLRKAGIARWDRLFHSMRATRQTELEKQHPLHVVCSWLGNSPKVANRSYLLVTESDFERAIQPDAKAEAQEKREVSKTQQKPDAKGEVARVRREPQERTKTAVFVEGNAIFPGNFDENQRMGRDSNPR